MIRGSIVYIARPSFSRIVTGRLTLTDTKEVKERTCKHTLIYSRPVRYYSKFENKYFIILLSVILIIILKPNIL